MQQDKAEVESPFHGFTESHMNEHDGAEPYECYPCHDGLGCEGKGYDIDGRDAACHVVAVYVGCLHESGVLSYGNGAAARCSGKRSGEILGEDLALRAARTAAFRYIEYGTLCLDGGVELGSYEIGVVNGVGHVHTRLDAGIRALGLAESFCQFGCEHLRGCARALGCYGNHKL